MSIFGNWGVWQRAWLVMTIVWVGTGIAMLNQPTTDFNAIFVWRWLGVPSALFGLGYAVGLIPKRVGTQEPEFAAIILKFYAALWIPFVLFAVEGVLSGNPGFIGVLVLPLALGIAIAVIFWIVAGLDRAEK